MSLVWICPESFSTLRSVKAKISSDICSVQLRKYGVSGFGWPGSGSGGRPGSAKFKDQPSANQQKLSEKCQICQEKSPKNFRKISHPELEISLYLPNFSMEVSKLTG